MTDTQFAACVREVPAYADVDAYVSDLALSSMWGDAETADIPAARIDQLRAIYAAVNRPVRAIVTASTRSQAALPSDTASPAARSRTGAAGSENAPCIPACCCNALRDCCRYERRCPIWTPVGRRTLCQTL